MAIISPTMWTRSLSDRSGMSNPSRRSFSAIINGGGIPTRLDTENVRTPRFLISAGNREAVTSPEKWDPPILKALDKPLPVTLTLVYGDLIEDTRLISFSPRSSDFSKLLIKHDVNCFPCNGAC